MKISHWFTGVVESTNDPLQLGRAQVRCMGYHTPDLTLLPSQDLPWATVILPTTSASICGIGLNHSMSAGTWVFGFFRDAELQDPVIIGTIPGASSSTGFSGRPSAIGFQDPMGTYPLRSGPDAPAGSLAYTNGNNPGFANAQQSALSSSGIYSPTGKNTTATSTTGTSNDPVPVATGPASAIANVGLTQIGVVEPNHDNRGPGIEKYWTATSSDTSGYGQAWCAAFVCWCVQQSGIIDEKHRPKTASAFGLETDWAASNPALVQIIKNPREAQPGDIVIFSFSHAAIVVKQTEKGFQLIQGNSISNGVEGVILKDTAMSSVRSLLRIKSPTSSSSSMLV